MNMIRMWLVSNDFIDYYVMGMAQRQVSTMLLCYLTSEKEYLIVINAQNAIKTRAKKSLNHIAPAFLNKKILKKEMILWKWFLQKKTQPQSLN